MVLRTGPLNDGVISMKGRIESPVAIIVILLVPSNDITGTGILSLPVIVI